MSTEKVEINSAVAEKSIEDQIKDLKEQGIDIDNLESEDGTKIIVSEPNTETETIENQRPEWLPEKFKSAEDLSKAYSELEKQFSSQKSEPLKKEANGLTIPKDDGKTVENEITPQVTSLEKFTEEYSEKGELGEASYGELAKQGLSKELVDGYIAGQKAIADTQTANIHSVVGGKEEYNELISWAETNLSEAEQNAFNDLADTGTTEQIKMAVQGLMAKAGVTSPSQQKFVEGNVNNISTDQFTSVSQVTDAINDPRYEKDHVYRKNVERKLGNSSVF